MSLSYTFEPFAKASGMEKRMKISQPRFLVLEDGGEIEREVIEMDAIFLD